MNKSYDVRVRDVDYDLHEEFKTVLRENGIALSGQFSKVRQIQNDIYHIGLKQFLKNPNKILYKFRG